MSGKNIKNSKLESDPAPSPLAAGRLIVRRALKGALGTLDRRSGHPYASLVTLATEPDGSPLLLLSKLALHTQNIADDARASVLFDGTSQIGDPLAGGRITLIGRIVPATSTSAKARFLARHPAAEMYAGFADFSFYTLAVENAHYIGGFGRIVDLAARDLLLDLHGAQDLVSAEAGIVSHMNEDHAAALALYATAFCGAPGGPWRMTGIDPEGLDLLCDGDARRVLFDAPVTTPAAARQELVRLAALAREQAGDA